MYEMQMEMWCSIDYLKEWKSVALLIIYYLVKLKTLPIIGIIYMLKVYQKHVHNLPFTWGSQTFL